MEKLDDPPPAGGAPQHCWSSSNSPSSNTTSEMDVPVCSPLKVFLKNNLFSDVVLHVYKIASPTDDDEEEKMEMDGLSDALEESSYPRKKLKCNSIMNADTEASSLTSSAISSISSSTPCSSVPFSSIDATSIDATSLDPSITPLCPSSCTASLDALKFNTVNSEGCTTLKELGNLAPTPIFSSLPGTIPHPASSQCSESVTSTSSPTDVLMTEHKIPPLPPCTSSSLSSTTTTTTTTTTTASTLASPCSPISLPPPCSSLSSLPSLPPRSPSKNARPTCIHNKPSTPAAPRPTISLNGHRCVLAAHSKFFYMMFSNGMKESFEKEVKVYVEDVPLFEKMFEYFYTGSIDFKNTCLLKLLELCLQFDVPRLCCDVSSYLSANLTLSNAFEVFEFARTRLGKAHPLFAKTVEYVLSNFFNIFRGAPPSICHLSSSSLRYLLKSDKLNVSMEYYAFMALRFWAEHTSAKESEIKDLLPYIRLSQIDVDRLRNLVRPSKLGVVCPELFKYYMTALEYHASSPEMQPYLPMCDTWKRKRDMYKQSEFISFKWQFKWSGLTNWVYHWTHLQGYKLFATLGKHEDGTFGMYFVPSANEHKQFCLKAELKVYLTNKTNEFLCPELKLEPTIFKSDSKTPLNSIAKGWATKVDPTKLVDDVIVMKIKARICET